MRIISGSKRGLVLFTLDGLSTRPTLDRVKETMFNVINFELVDENCLDVFAGSGSLGLEALSRGASQVYFIEKKDSAIEIVNKNIQKAKFMDKSTVIKEDFKVALKKIKEDNVKFSIVFLDPPYNDDYYEEVLDLLIKYDLLNEDAIVICEHLIDLEIDHKSFYVWKQKTFSTNALSFLKILDKEDYDDFHIGGNEFFAD